MGTHHSKHTATPKQQQKQSRFAPDQLHMLQNAFNAMKGEDEHVNFDGFKVCNETVRLKMATTTVVWDGIIYCAERSYLTRGLNHHPVLMTPYSFTPSYDRNFSACQAI